MPLEINVLAHLILYSTSGCHLCEEAQQLIYRTLGYTVPEVDVADDDELLQHYGVRIPVLQRTDTRVEIGWPFGADEVLTLANRSSSEPCV